jgi:hypothetical protein
MMVKKLLAQPSVGLFIELDGGRNCIVEQTLNQENLIESTIKLFKDANIALIAKDLQISKDKFTRTIESGKDVKVWVYNMSGKKLLQYTDINTKFIPATNPDSKLTNKIIAFDLETRVKKVSDRTFLEPFLACFTVYTQLGPLSSTFFLGDYPKKQNFIFF